MAQKGFTLIEVVIAVAIISIALAAFMEGMAMNIKSSVISKQKYLSANYAKELIEEIKLKTFGATSGTITGGSGNGRRNSWTTIDEYNGYNESILTVGTDNGIIEFDEVGTGYKIFPEGLNYYRVVTVDWVEDATWKVTATATNTKRVKVDCFLKGTSTQALSSLEWFIRK